MPITGNPEKVASEAVKGELEKAKAAVKEAREAAEKLVNDAYEKSLNKAERSLRDEIARAEEQLKSLMSVLDLELKSKLAEAKNKYIDEVLEEAMRRLKQEKQGADWYKEYMERVIKAIAEEAPGKMLVKVAEEDAQLASSLISKYGGGKLELAGEYIDIIGGAIAETPDGSTKLDYSLDLLFKMEEYRLRSAASRALFKE
ncbi:MAG: V-type ATP synthase subunit E [Desulfurococcales archaeon]|nr:V-type ATP synthase subunit E [Desulfurococcales archaeon]